MTFDQTQHQMQTQIDRAALLAILEQRMEPRLSMDRYKGDEYGGPGFSCCGCSSLTLLYNEIWELIEKAV